MGCFQYDDVESWAFLNILFDFFQGKIPDVFGEDGLKTQRNVPTGEFRCIHEIWKTSENRKNIKNIIL